MLHHGVDTEEHTNMKITPKNSAIVLIVLIIMAGLYYILMVKGGVFSASLPEPQVIDPSLVQSPPTQTTELGGAVLGESQNTDSYSNPLKDIYVNPFK